MLFKISVLAFIAAVHQVTAKSGGFIQTCNGIAGDYTIMEATCGDGHGGYTQTSIDLNGCFINDSGYIVYQVNGDFGASCDYIQVSSQGILTATCGNGQGGYGHDTIKLNDYVGNSGGNLVC